MSAPVKIASVSGETPALEFYHQLKDILDAFGVDAAAFDSLPQPAQVFLVGQYMQLRKSEDLLSKLSRKLDKAERDVKRLRFQRDHLRDVISSSGVNERDLSAFSSQPLITRRMTPMPEPERNEDETRNVRLIG